MKIHTLFRSSKVLALLLALVVGLIYTKTIHGQQYRTTAQIQNAIERLEKNTDRFQSSLNSALDRSRFNNTDVEDQANALVDEMENATDRLNNRAEDNLVNRLDVNEVLRKGLYINMFMQRNSLSTAAQSDWRMVRFDLDQLARYYGIPWKWEPTSIHNSKLSRSWTKEVINRLEETTDQFRSSFDEGLDNSRLDGSSYEDFMNKVVAQFDSSVDRLEHDANRSRDLNPDDIRVVLNNAAAIDDFLRRQTLNTRTRRDWARVKANLDDLAYLNRVAWDWRNRSNMTPVASAYPQARGERVGLSSMTANPSLSAIEREVRHQLLSDLPYYSVFDWIEFETLPDRSVILRGEVTTPPDTKSRAEAVVKDVDGVSRVVNEIRVLPVSPNDDRLRRAIYTALYSFNSPLYRYGIGSNQAIHIIVDGGRATLKGVVETQSDKDQAYIRTRGVSGLFSVTNDLRVRGEGLPR